jgi:hypothetical protein
MAGQGLPRVYAGTVTLAHISAIVEDAHHPARRCGVPNDRQQPPQFVSLRLAGQGDVPESRPRCPADWPQSASWAHGSAPAAPCSMSRRSWRGRVCLRATWEPNRSGPPPWTPSIRPSRARSADACARPETPAMGMPQRSLRRAPRRWCSSWSVLLCFLRFRRPVDGPMFPSGVRMSATRTSRFPRQGPAWLSG